MKPQRIIFTDLDGTLLDLETYAFQAAAATVQHLITQHVPLIFCSSKTRCEQEYYQQQLGLCAPMIVENGAAIVSPAKYFPSFAATEETDLYVLGASVHFIRQEFRRLQQKLQLNVRGFAELSLEELCAWTGLDAAAAVRAKQRDFSETLVGTLTAAEEAALTTALTRQGLTCIRGSRFLTITSAQTDKGKAVTWLVQQFRQKYPEVLTIGLGDGANDLPMLNVVDQPFFLQKTGDRIPVLPPAAKIIEGTGSRVWAALVEEILAESK